MELVFFFFFLINLLCRVALSFVRIGLGFLPVYESLFLSVITGCVIFSAVFSLSPTPSWKTPFEVTEKARVYETTKQFDNYVQFTQQAVKQNPGIQTFLTPYFSTSLARENSLLIQALQKTAYVDEEILFWEKLYQIQPTHREVLMNLRHLYATKGEAAQSDAFFKQAQLVDPNHPEVK